MQSKKTDNTAGLSSAAPSETGSRWLGPKGILLLILLAGAVLRFWGITERSYMNADTSLYWNMGERYHMAWEWYRSGAHKQVTFPDYVTREAGVYCVDGDCAKPLIILIRGLIIIATGQRSIILYSALDIIFAVLAMWLMLKWCHRTLGFRIAVLAGCLWLIGGSQFIDTGRGYDNSIVMLCATVTWLLLMNRLPARLYANTFLAGLMFGIACCCHWMTLVFIPLCAVFVVLYYNSQGLPGKIKEMAAFAAGFVTPAVAVFLFYMLMTRLTGVAWSYGLMANLECGKEDGGSISQRLGFMNIGNEMFILRYLNGIPFLLCIAIGVVVIAALHLRRYRWRWSICDDPLFILNGVVGYGFFFWGCYYYKAPRGRMLELTVWPVVAAIGIHYLTAFLANKMWKGRFLNTIQLVVLAGVLATMWPPTAPLIKMGEGIRKAMMAIDKEGKTAYGENRFTAWENTIAVKNPICPTSLLWDSFDNYLETNRYDYCYVDYAFILSYILTYPGAGQELMLHTYNKLSERAQPVWRFRESGAIPSIFEYSRLEWTRQFYEWNVWRRLHPQSTLYDVLVANVDYVDVYRASDVIRLCRECRIELLAELMALSQRDPRRFQQIAPQLGSFISYNKTNEVIMHMAQELAAKRK